MRAQDRCTSINSATAWSNRSCLSFLDDGPFDCALRQVQGPLRDPRRYAGLLSLSKYPAVDLWFGGPFDCALRQVQGPLRDPRRYAGLLSLSKYPAVDLWFGGPFDCALRQAQGPLRGPKFCAKRVYDYAGLLYFDKLSNRIVEVSCGF